MKQSYECHITILLTTEATFLKLDLERLGWHYSCINGDPDLGAGVKHYATKHFDTSFTKDYVKGYLNAVAESLKSEYIKVIRQKIELILYDTKE